MHKTFYITRTNYKFFKWNIFSKTEVYTEFNKECQSDDIMEVLVEEEYFEREFNIKGDSDKPE